MLALTQLNRSPCGNGGIIVHCFEHAMPANCWQPLQEVMASCQGYLTLMSD
jgi:hypothetical protein